MGNDDGYSREGSRDRCKKVNKSNGEGAFIKGDGR